MISIAGKKTIRKINWRVYILLIPGLLFVSIFTFYPIAKMLIMSFFNWKIGYQQVSDFVGLDNYKNVLTDPIARKAMVNTLVYAVVTVPLQIVFGLLIAVLINGTKRFSVTFRLGYYLPVITSWVVVALLFKYIFSNQGLLNFFLSDILHIVDGPVGWLSTRWSALFIAMLLGIWKGIGWNMIIFLAALQAVPKEYYEASSIDGLNRRQQFFYITLPSIRGTILFALVMLCIGAFNTYTPIAVLTGGNPAHETEVVLTWMYFQTFNATGKMGYSAALSMIIAATIILITIAIFISLAREEN
ncbi:MULTISPECIES: carbohydrate ABC transporter permease [Mesobacillus]|uniref:ABC transporter permease n=2 Tax=Mesobacillus TaxID=2675231 RepID=A0A0D6ZF18_9BACI|nr:MULTISPECIES: sugar ABC transporter permease [Mesobacillus]KIY23850.1 ABC transporter permease [Mesobacillus subterraneus]MDQ0415470.1 multiple sugar transport system permease protein [Mesobacillus stamsii]